MDQNYSVNTRQDNDEIVIDLMELFRVLWKKKWIIGAAAIVGGLLLFAYGKFFVAPAYESTTRIIVLNANEDYGQQEGQVVLSGQDLENIVGIMDETGANVMMYNANDSILQRNNQLRGDCIQLISSHRVVETVIKTFDLDEEYDDFVNRLDVKSDSSIIEITLTDNDPLRAKQMVDVLRDAAIECIKEVLAIEAVDVVDEGNVPTPKLDSNVSSYILIGVLIGFALSVAIILVKFLLDDTIKSVENVEKYLHLNTLGSIPITENVSDFQLKEAYKSLRAYVDYSAGDMKVVAVTSCLPQEGKSSVAYELANVYAQNSKRVLLIEGDLRKPVLASRYSKREESLGLVDYLMDKCSFEEMVCESNIQNLSIVYAGKVSPNPSELLDNKCFKDMIDSVKTCYDMVFIDTPSLSSVIDGTIIAKQCDGVIMVIANGEVSYRLAQEVKERLSQSGCQILGCVLNKMEVTKGNKKKRYYDSYYDTHKE